MQLTLTAFIKSVFFKFVWLPSVVLAISFPFFTYFWTVKQVSVSEKFLIESNYDSLVQVLLAGNLESMNRQISTLAKLAQWDYVEIKQANDFTFAYYPFEEIKSCTQNVVNLKINQTDVGTICFSRNLFQKTLLAMWPAIILFLLILAFFFISNSIIANILNRISNRFQVISNSILSNDKDVIDKIIPDVFEEQVFINSFKEYIKVQEIRYQQEKILMRQEAFATISKQVAHDIRSPLSTLNLVFSTLNDVADEKKSLIISASRRISDIADDLLNTSKINPSANQINSVNFSTDFSNINEVINEIILEKKEQISNISFDYVNNKSDVLFARISSIELKRIVSNILNNSIEAISHDYGKIIVSVHESDNSVVLSISDNGLGIPQEVLSRIGSEAITFGKSGGNGLGLTHAKRILESYGGQLVLESNYESFNKKSGTTVKLIMKIYE